MAESSRVDSNRVMGCTSRVWVEVGIDEEGKVRVAADSDSEITRGFCACLVWVLDGSKPDEVMKVSTDDLVGLNVGLPGGSGRSRVNTWHNVLVSMQKRTKQLVAQREGKVPFEPFPSLVITSHGIFPKGSYAEAQVSTVSFFFFNSDSLEFMQSHMLCLFAFFLVFLFLHNLLLLGLGVITQSNKILHRPKSKELWRVIVSVGFLLLSRGSDPHQKVEDFFE